MKAHLATTLIGALFIGSIACLRGAARDMTAPLAGLETMSRPERLAPVQFVEEENQADADVAQFEHASEEPAPLPRNPRRQRECGGTTGPLLNFYTQCLKVNEAQRSRILNWILWKGELLFDVQHDENQKKHVEETFERLVIAELDHAQAELYRGFFNLNRPPIGGYDISGVGFTDIDESADNGPGYVTHESARLETYDLRAQPDPKISMANEWSEWKRHSIQGLPEELRENSEHRKAIDARFKAAIQELIPPEEFEILEAYGFDVDHISRPPPPGGWSIGGVGFSDIGENVDDLTSSAKLLDILVNLSSETPVVYGVNVSPSVHGVNR